MMEVTSQAAPFLLREAGRLKLEPAGDGRFELRASIPLGGGPGLALRLGRGAHVRRVHVDDPVRRLMPNAAGRPVLLLDAGVGLTVTASGAFPYTVLKAGMTLETGAGAGFAYGRVLDAGVPQERALRELLAEAKLPDQVVNAPEPGELLLFRYGGYLGIGAELAAGYSLSGTKSARLGEIALSEKFGFTALGKIGLGARVAGDFLIAVTRSEIAGNWARIRVERGDSKSVSVAADVRVGVESAQEHLPDSAEEFLGSVLGVGSRNLLGVLREATPLERLDPLARQVLAPWMGKATELLRSYDQLGDGAVALVERFAGRLPDLKRHLSRIASLDVRDADAFRVQLSPELWGVLHTLTGRHPVEAVETSLDSVREAASGVLVFLEDPAHAALREMIAAVARQLRVETLMGELAKVRSAADLKGLIDQAPGQFAARLLGRQLGSSADLKAAFPEIQAVVRNLGSFSKKLNDGFRSAAKQSFALALHAQYARASESAALVDASVNLSHTRGLDLYRQAARGNFDALLLANDAALVQLHEGVFTHKVKRESAFRVNIAGWHAQLQYEGFDRVITETEQRLKVSDDGILVLTSASLELEKMRKRRDEQMHLDFLLRALGESKRAVRDGGVATRYLIDSLKGLSARFDLSFTDADTTEEELDDALAFALDLGIAEAARVKPLLPREASGSFGAVEIVYEVRFHESALMALLNIAAFGPEHDAGLRTALRKIVLANYLRGDSLHDVAFAYATAKSREAWKTRGGGFTKSSPLVFPVETGVAGLRAPRSVTLSGPELFTLDTLYRIENRMVEAVKSLYSALNAARPLSPAAFEKKLGKFGDALKAFDGFDQTSSRQGAASIFFVMDALVRLAGGGAAAASLLRIRSRVGNEAVEKILTPG